MDFLFVGFGLAMLVAGGEVLVRGGVGLAQRLGLPSAVIGATVLGFGTSTPELVTSLRAAFDGAPGIAIGNVVGSNIANILLILGCAALISPMALRGVAPVSDVIGLLIATAAGVLILLLGEAGRLAGTLLLMGLVAYLWVVLRTDRPAPAEGDLPVEAATMPLWRGFALAIAGIAVLVFGASLLVGGATRIAQGLGVSEAVIGLTLVAVGTSLPELATSVVAALRGQGAMSLGNILGSNIFNVAGILGLTALSHPLVVPPDIGLVDGGVLAVSALVLVGLIALGRIGRGAALALLAGYAGYIGWLAASA